MMFMLLYVKLFINMKSVYYVVDSLNMFNKLKVPITLVSINFLGLTIEVSTCDSAAK